MPICVKVPIKEELKKCLVFGVESRLGIANILRFSGYQEQVGTTMQQLSNGSRAFFYNAYGLEAFLVPSVIIEILK